MSRRTATLTALRAVVDRTEWAQIVESQLLPEWRPREWDPKTLIFTALLDTADALAYTCITPECGLPTLNKTNPCESCKHQLTTYRGERAAFRRTRDAHCHYTGRQRPRCAITHNGATCQRTAEANGLCETHRGELRNSRRTSGVTFEEFVDGCTTLHACREVCRVLGCDQELFNTAWGICISHQRQLNNHRRRRNPQLSVDGFIAMARPLVQIHQFSLTGLTSTLRSEILYVLQRRDDEGHYVAPHTVRRVIRQIDKRGSTSLLELTEAVEEAESNAPALWFLRSARLHLTRLRVRYGLHDAYAGDVWDAALLGLPVSRSGERAARGSVVGFNEITLPWLKDLAKEWVRRTEPDLIAARHVINASKWACEALQLRSGGHEPTQLALADMTAVVRKFNTATKPGGLPYTSSNRRRTLRAWRTLLEFGRAAGQMDDVPAEFVVLNSIHRLDESEPEEEKAGKSIPVEVIRVLDAHIDSLRPPTDKGFADVGADDLALMYQTMYFIFRNTGRRSDEVMSLKRDCLRYNGSGDPSLVYDNRKAKRLGRWLHIDKDTAMIIERWQHHLDNLKVLPERRVWLFPGVGRRGKCPTGHYQGPSFLNAFNKWKETLPPIHYGGIDADGNPRVFDINLISLHKFRHTYAQRHADAGTPVDVLCELMDHVSINTTMGYYQVSLKRKAEAVRTVGALSVDRDGNRSPHRSAAAYEAASVAVGPCPRVVDTGFVVRRLRAA